MRITMLVINAVTHDTRVQKEAKTLTAAGHEVNVFGLHREGLAKCEAFDGFQVTRIAVRTRSWGSSKLIRIINYLEFAARSIRSIVRQKPDVVHAHDVDAVIPAYIASRILRSRLVYDAHELWAERRAALLGSSWLRRLIRLAEGTLARRSDAVITVNASIADLLAQRYAIPTPTVLMHCQEYEFVESSNILRQTFKIPEDQRIVIYAGLFIYGRGLENLIETAKDLDQATVVMMGPDRMSGQLQRLIEERGLQDRVFIHEPVAPSDVTRYVASADLGVVPTQNVDLSYYYGLGNKVFHYFMAGIPAAVSNHPEKRRLVMTYGVGVVFDETDPCDIARVINQLLNDPQSYEAMCDRARQVSRDVFNWQLESKKLLNLYVDLEEADSQTIGKGTA